MYSCCDASSFAIPYVVFVFPRNLEYSISLTLFALLVLFLIFAIPPALDAVTHFLLLACHSCSALLSIAVLWSLVDFVIFSLVYYLLICVLDSMLSSFLPIGQGVCHYTHLLAVLLYVVSMLS